jgi:hypothetical protein
LIVGYIKVRGSSVREDQPIHDIEVDACRGCKDLCHVEVSIGGRYRR